MPYSNQRRHNLPSNLQAPYQILFTPCPDFDPIYQVILQENSNEWNLSSAKTRILEKNRKKKKREKRGARNEKKKR
jgi:hypothetical protein